METLKKTELVPAPAPAPQPVASRGGGNNSGGGNSGGSGGGGGGGGGDHTEGGAFPIYVITAANFYCEVKLDEYNFQFSVEAQVLEACSWVLERFKNIGHPELELIMFSDCRDQSPSFGSTLLVSVKGEDPNKAAVIFSHVVLANIGFYNESPKMEAILHQQLERIEGEQKKVEAQQAQNVKDMQFLDTLKKEITKPKGAKGKTKKSKPVNKKK